MKIISLVPDDHVLVKLTRDELAKVLGQTYFNQVGTDRVNKAIKDDEDLSISDIYAKHQLIQELQKQADYEKARTKLENMLKALTPIENKLKLLSKANS